MSDFKNFMRLYSNISCIHYSRVFELMKLYNSDKEKYKTQFSRVLSCLSIWENRNARIKELEEREKKLIECIGFYAEGEIGCDLEIRPEKRELWSIPDKWSQRSMSDHYAGKRARETLKELGINNE